MALVLLSAVNVAALCAVLIPVMSHHANSAAQQQQLMQRYNAENDK